MTSSNFEVNLSLKGYEKLKREIESIGPSGAKAMGALERSVRQPTTALRALDSAVARSSQGLQSLAYSAGPAGEVLSGLGRGGLAAAAGVGALIVSLAAAKRAISESIRTYDQLDDAALRIGISAENFQELNYAFGQIGISAEKTERSLTKFNRSIGDVVLRGKDAPKELREAFEALGLSVQDVQRGANNMPGLLARVADGLSGLDSQSKRTAAAMSILGRSGAELLPLLTQGGDALEMYMQKAHDVGAVLDNDLVQAYSTAGDALAELDQRWDAQIGILVGGMLPAYMNAKTAVVDLLTEINGLIGTLPEAERFWQAFSDAAFRPLGPIRSILEALGLLESKLNQVQHGASGSWGDGAGLVVDGITPSGIEPPNAIGRPPVRPEAEAWAFGLTLLDRELAAKALANRPPLNAPRPTPRPDAAQRYTYGGGTFGTAPAFDFSPGPQFDVSNMEENFKLTDDMVRRLEDGKTAYDDLTQANNMWADAAATTAGTLTATFSGVFADMAMGAETSAEEIVNSLKRIILQTIIAIALQKALAAAMAGSTGGVGAAPFALSAAAAGGGATGTAPTFTFHGGRGPGEFGAPTNVPLSLLKDAPKFHTGRLGSDEMYAKIRKDESVLTPAQMRAVGSPSVVVNVEKSNGVSVDVGEPQMTSEGLLLKIKADVATDISRNGTLLNTVVRNAGQVKRR